MTECNGCGSCCDPVMLPYDQRQIRMMLPGEKGLDPETRRFVLEDLTPIPRREGLAKSPFLTEGGRTVFMTAQKGGVPRMTTVVESFFYRCRWFDEDSRRCTNYDARPEICSMYPWYGEPPDGQKAIPLWCSFRADVDKVVHEVPVEIRPKQASNP